jgi:nucleoside-diphosphate-sugar epimerase
MILITGANGFLGSWIASLLDSRGMAWHGLCNLDSNMSRLAYLPKNKISCINNVTWVDFIKRLKPNVIISCDWEGVVNDSRNNENIQYTNVERLSSIAQASITSGVQKFIAFGSQAENGPINQVALEVNYDSPTTHYGIAKVQARKALGALFENSNTQFTWGRIFSTYGQTDNIQWLIPSMVKSFLNKKDFKLTSGQQEWSYLHAYDFANAVLNICTSSVYQGLVNIGNPETTRIINVAKKIASYMDCLSLLEVGSQPMRMDQVLFLKPDVSSLTNSGWTTTVTLNSGLESFVNWATGRENSFQGINLANFAQ